MGGGAGSFRGRVGAVVTFPAPITYRAAVGLLRRELCRPEPARALPNFPAWGAPKQHTAWCPVCRTDGSLVVEPFSQAVPQAVFFCTNEYRCPSWEGARTERDVHNALWAYFDRRTSKAAA